MAELSTIARPYAEAAFKSAQPGQIAAWADMLDRMAAVNAHSEVHAVLANPNLSNAQVANVFEGVLNTPLDAPAKNFLHLMIENGRLDALPEVARQFRALKNAAEGTADALVVSAFELSPAQLAELLSGLEKKFGSKLKATVQVDPSLIGGVRVTVGDLMLDTSVAAQLEQMKHALRA